MPLLDTLARPGTAADGHGQPGTRTLLVSICLAALAVAVAGLVPAVALSMVGWVLADGSVGPAGTGSAAAATRTGGLLWLGAHGGAPVLGTTTISLVPLLAPLLVGALGVRAGRWAATGSAGASDTGRSLAAAGAGAATYAAVVGLVGWGVSTSGAADAVDVHVLRAVALSLAGAGLAFGAGIGHVAGAWTGLWAQSPVELRAIARGTAAAAVALLSSSALVLVVMLCVHADRLLTVGRGLAPGLVGGVALALLCVATMPNAVLWTMSYVVGPGFAVGPGTAVAPAGVLVGPLPAYPLLGAIPGPGEPPGWVVVLTALPLLAGVVGGVVSTRALSPGGWTRLVLTGAGAGAGAGLLLAALMLLSGGGVGPGRMQTTGPLVAAAVVLVLTMPVAAGAGAVGCRLLAGHGNPRAWGRWTGPGVQGLLALRDRWGQRRRGRLRGR